MLKLIVTSETYRQSSAASAELLARDHENRLLARGARFRLPSWMLRDAALKSSGLLNVAIGGPPVRPFQPEGVWEEMFMGRFKYEPSEGAAQYRRTLYAFWRRAIAPTFLFDSAQRRVCEVRQSRTNTPLQALTLLNDANYLVAARTLAANAIRQEKKNSERINSIVHKVLLRSASDTESKVLQRELDRALSHFQKQPNDAQAFLRQTAMAAAETSLADASKSATTNQTATSDSDLAAFTLIASLILNLDETLNHE